MRHHTLVVASCLDTDIEQAHKQAAAIFPWVSEVGPGQGNGYRAFFIPPDGSKEGWPRSADGDASRADFITWLEEADSVAYPGSRLGVDWCEVIFGDDGCQDRLVRSNGTDASLESDKRNKPDGDHRDYLRCPLCDHHLVIYTYEAKGEFEGAVYVSGYEPDYGIRCPACDENGVDTEFELRSSGWTIVSAGTAAIGPRSRLASVGE